jgi:hypothetical protein
MSVEDTAAQRTVALVLLFASRNWMRSRRVFKRLAINRCRTIRAEHHLSYKICVTNTKGCQEIGRWSRFHGVAIEFILSSGSGP